eukprot:TRINITY_DN43206_c0_g1_i1.p1 TRINITY_DN43206_c0_g1~~TRINITY_DN43206_c0_g1_i1.p1  ORF type:complete len:346 (-),score=91.05 TRINITY_DN43206_c0_g1_i1:49-939(-)
MGYHMAGHMAKLHGQRCLVWNRSGEKAQQHSREFGSEAVADVAKLGSSQVVVFCLPTSTEDEALAAQVAPHLAKDSCIVSCTSGVPSASRELAASLRERFGVHFLDCPVSGGPRGAAAGSLTGMLGSDSEDAVQRALPVVRSFASKVVRCGPAGSGHAVKAVNNAMNVAHLALAAEGLLALQHAGVDPAVALDAINGSSGRSLQTEQRIPQEILTRRFGYGFKLPLMAKDCRIAAGVLQEGFPSACLLPTAVELVQKAKAEMPEDADYTAVVRHLEQVAGREIRSGPGSAEGSTKP